MRLVLEAWGVNSKAWVLRGERFLFFDWLGERNEFPIGAMTSSHVLTSFAYFPSIMSQVQSFLNCLILTLQPFG